MYTYAASSTGLDAAMPLWVQEGGIEAWVGRLKDPALRARALAEMRRGEVSENSNLVVREPAKVLLLGFKTEALKPLTGRTLGEVARERGKSPEETAADLIVEDNSRIQVAYFSMSEDNVRREVALPWMSFGSDASAQAPEGVFLKSSTHPARLRQFRPGARQICPRREGADRSQEAVRRMTSLPAANLGLKDRGALRPGHYRRPRPVRPGDDPRQRHLRRAAAIRHRNAPRLRQRSPGAARRRAHRRHPGPVRARAGRGEVSGDLIPSPALGGRGGARREAAGGEGLYS